MSWTDLGFPDQSCSCGCAGGPPPGCHCAAWSGTFPATLTCTYSRINPNTGAVETQSTTLGCGVAECGWTGPGGFYPTGSSFVVGGNITVVWSSGTWTFSAGLGAGGGCSETSTWSGPASLPVNSGSGFAYSCSHFGFLIFNIVVTS